jgi:hypothetical protein
MKVSFPSFNEYQATLQNPGVCFSLPELQKCSVEADLWGLPRVRSGGFALTYQLTDRMRSKLALRCFHRYVPDRNTRYAAISAFLQENPSEILIPTHYLPTGILIRGKWFPVTYMKWIEGDTLEAFLVKNATNSPLMHQLSQDLIHVAVELERLQIAHGDLSHRNILIQNNKMILVDYDGMYVPELKGKKSCEIGNIHFQLPGRTEAHFNPELDRFSEIVIYLALEALARNPGLWARYETGGEGLLFQRSDFANPYQSALLTEMEILPGLGPLVSQFRHICTSEVSLLPRLVDFIQARPVDLVRRERPVKPAVPLAILDATQRLGLIARAGKVVTVIGKVTEVFRGTSIEGQPHIFLNFGDWQTRCCTIVIWNDALQLLEAARKSPDDYLGQWISVSGMVTNYQRRPQIFISSPTDISRIGEVEARRVLDALRDGKSQPTALQKVSQIPARPMPTGDKISDTSKNIKGTLDQTAEIRARLAKLYAGRKVSPHPDDES